MLRIFHSGVLLAAIGIAGCGGGYMLPEDAYVVAHGDSRAEALETAAKLCSAMNKQPLVIDRGAEAARLPGARPNDVTFRCQ